MISLLGLGEKNGVDLFQNTAGLPSDLVNSGIVFYVGFRDKLLQKKSGDSIGKITTLLEAHGENCC